MLARPRFACEFECNYSVHDDEFLNTVGHILGVPLLPANSIQPIEGKATQRLYKMIAEAKRTLCIETSTNWKSIENEEIIELLADKARSGLPVHFIITHQSAKNLLSPRQRALFLSTDVEVYESKGLFKRINQKTTSQGETLLTADGSTTFFYSSPFSLIIEGPVVGQIQGSFNESWMQLQEQIAHGEFYFAPKVFSENLNSFEAVRAQYFCGSHRKTDHLNYLNLAYAVGLAKDQILIDTKTCLIPGIEKELKKAEQRKVRVEKKKSPIEFLISDNVWNLLKLKEKTFFNIYSTEFASFLARQ